MDREPTKVVPDNLSSDFPSPISAIVPDKHEEESSEGDIQNVQVQVHHLNEQEVQNMPAGMATPQAHFSQVFDDTIPIIGESTSFSESPPSSL